MTDSADHNPKPSTWQWDYQAAMRETNALFLGEKIYAAEAAIRMRQKEVEKLPDAEEKKSLEEALHALQNLRIKTFGHSDWQT